MKKIPTLFKKSFDNNNNYIGVINEFNTEIDGLNSFIANNWDNVVATIKFDGSACMVKDNRIYKRWDNKKNRPLPDGAIFCDDHVEGHNIYWIPCIASNPSDKYFFEAFEYEKVFNCLINPYDEDIETVLTEEHDEEHGYFVPDGTYELVGPKVANNPYNIDKHLLLPHGILKCDVDINWDSIKTFIEKNTDDEGLVFWTVNNNNELEEPIAKLRRRDFGFEWNNKGK